LLSIEVLTKCMTSRIYYSEYQREDIFKLLLFVLKADLSNLSEYFSCTKLNDVENITYLEAENVFNLVYNFLNMTNNEKYSPFPFLKTIFEYKNKENQKPMEEWALEYDSFKIQLKRLIPFTIKFLGKYFESQTMYNPTFAMTSSGEPLFSASTLNAKTVKMPVLTEKVLEKSSLIDRVKWTTLFLAMPNLEFCRDFDVIYNSSSDGLSFNRLSNHVIGYKGPMIFLIKHIKAHDEEDKQEEMAEDCILGAYLSEELKDNAKFGGDLNS
jgi:hypothetical protein